MNRTKIIEHYKEFMQLDKMQEDYQIDIDWMQAFIEDNNLVNKDDLLPLVSNSLPKSWYQVREKAKDLTGAGFKVWWERNFLGYDC